MNARRLSTSDFLKGTLLATCLAGASAHAQAELRVLPPDLDGAPPAEMTHRLLRRSATHEFRVWRAGDEWRANADEIRGWQTEMRERLLDALGGFPERTPLNPRIVGSIELPDYRVEKVVLESRPGFCVTGALFLPRVERHAAPWPAVLVPCGHSRDGKGSDAYQRACALSAMHGIAALVFDPIDQGERIQLLDDADRAMIWGTEAHTHAGVGAILLGQNLATYEVWDAIRCLDWLESRPDIDGERLGCMGNSGGGTQTAYLVALDDRIRAAAPSCFITNIYERILELGPQDAEQNLFGQLAWHFDHADYLTLRAPTPILICAATQDFFDIRGTRDSFRWAKRRFARLGHPERIDLVEHDAGHGWAQPLREASVAWMLRWLAGRDVRVAEPPDLRVPGADAIRCTPHGQVLREPGARSIYGLLRDELARCQSEQRESWARADPERRRALVREIAGIRPIATVPELSAREYPPVELDGVAIERFDLTDGSGLHLPALVARPPHQEPAGAALLVDARGNQAAFEPGGLAHRLLAQGRIVCAVDVRGSGETRRTGQHYHRGQGSDGVDVYLAYLLGLSYVGMRAEDVLATARWLRDETGVEQLELHAAGALAVPALHARFVEPAMFRAVTVTGAISSWGELVRDGRYAHQLENAVHGALRGYDLPDLTTGR